jgi:hypothetical protein
MFAPVPRYRRECGWNLRGGSGHDTPNPVEDAFPDRAGWVPRRLHRQAQGALGKYAEESTCSTGPRRHTPTSRLIVLFLSIAFASVSLEDAFWNALERNERKTVSELVATIASNGNSGNLSSSFLRLFVVGVDPVVGRIASRLTSAANGKLEPYSRQAHWLRPGHHRRDLAFEVEAQAHSEKLCVCGLRLCEEKF